MTFCVDRRRRLLDHDHAKQIVVGQLNTVLERTDGRCVGFVIMPDHVHAVIWLPVLGRLGYFLHEWKRRSSLEIRAWMRTELSNYFDGIGEGDRLWQPRHHSFEIYDERKLEEKLHYMHLNPVRWGLVERAADWKWSSARWYESRQTVGVPITWVS